MLATSTLVSLFAAGCVSMYCCWDICRHGSNTCGVEGGRGGGRYHQRRRPAFKGQGDSYQYIWLWHINCKYIWCVHCGKMCFFLASPCISKRILASVASSSFSYGYGLRPRKKKKIPPLSSSAAFGEWGGVTAFSAHFAQWFTLKRNSCDCPSVHTT